MVQKIQYAEYLKRYSNMTAVERLAYLDRVGKWLQDGFVKLAIVADDADARFKNAITSSMTWNDAECGAFQEGAVLLSALVNVRDTWLPDLLYVKAARRCIGKMHELLDGIYRDCALLPKEGLEETGEETGEPRGNSRGTAAAKAAVVRGDAGAGVRGDAGAERTAKEMAEETGKEMAKGKGKGENRGIPVRPKHIDQYVHLFPKGTQERAAGVRELLRELDDAREKERVMMMAGEQGVKIAQWAKKVTELDSKLKTIYSELDREWEKLVKAGRVVVDALGNASVVERGRPSADAEGTAAGEGPELSSEAKAQRRELRKFLVDTRRGNGRTREKYVEKWKDAFKRYLTYESMDTVAKDKKILDAAEHYGIAIDQIK